MVCDADDVVQKKPFIALQEGVDHIIMIYDLYIRNL